MATKRKNPEGIEWTEEPPEPQRGRGRKDYDRIVSVLQQNPGRWAKVDVSSNNSAYVALKKRGCEVRMVSIGDKKFKVVASWPAED